MPLKTQSDEQVSLNLTPMIDIVFLLIIFFMVGTQFTDLEKQLALEVPKVTSAGAVLPAPEKRIVNVFKDGRIMLGREYVTLEELVEQLKVARSEYAELGVIVRGDGEGPLQNTAAALDACVQAGVSPTLAVKHVVLR